MSSDGKDERQVPAPKGPAGADDELATSDDLFGHLVDAPIPDRDSRRPGRRVPIRVTVDDPVAPGPFSAMPDETDAEADAGERPEPEEGDHGYARLGQLLAESIFRPAPPVSDDEEARLPPSADRTGAKLSITDPKIPEVHTDLERRGIAFRFSDARGPLREVLQAVGLEARVGPIQPATSVASLIREWETAMAARP